jgi:predicted PurR-regulated permease PerM
MNGTDQSSQVSGPTRISYAIMAGVFVLMAWLHMASLLLSACFAYLLLTKLQSPQRQSRWLAVTAFLVFLAGAAYFLGAFVNHAIRALPEIADKGIPSMFQWVRQFQIELPFSDYDTLRDFAFDTVKSEVRYLGGFAKFARGASTQLVFLVAGCIVAISVFLHPQFDLRRTPGAAATDLYSACCDEIETRFRTFFASFVTVMGAQLLISACNTVLTAIFALAVHLPHALVVIGFTLLCGLLPIVGNLISNTIIVAIGFTVSPRMALAALIFLVVIHKLEYLLNSKIIGHRIHNPLWLTLLGLIVGERLMGIPGMILAPVALHYLRVETSRLPVKSAS